MRFKIQIISIIFIINFVLVSISHSDTPPDGGFPEIGEPTTHVLSYICGSVAYSGVSCGQLTNQYLQNKTWQFINSYGISETDTFVNKIFNAQTGSVTVINFYGTGLGGFSIVAATPSAQDQQIMSDINQLQSNYEILKDLFTFKEIDDGVFVNERGQSVSQVLAMSNDAGSASNNQSTSSSGDGADFFSNCRTSVDYLYNSRVTPGGARCTDGLDSYIRDISKNIHTDNLRDFASKLNAKITIGFIEISPTIDNVLQFKVEFNDDSVLVIDIKLNSINDSVTPEINMDQSISATGASLRNFQDRVDNNADVPQDLSTEEAMALGSGTGDTSCYVDLAVLGYNQRFKVKVLERDPQTGRPTRVRITLISNTPQFGQVVICSSGALNP